MLAAGRTAASSSLLRVLTLVPQPYPIPATPLTTTSANPTSHIITTSKRTLTTSRATHQEQQEQQEQEQPSQTPSPTQPTHPQDLSTQIRLLMRQVPYPVAIITSTDPHAHAHAHTSASASHPSPSPFRGMTVSSFNTVTLHPTPIISFNVRRPSETLTALQSSGRFLVHLLAPHARTAALARDFSRGNRRLGISHGLHGTTTATEGGGGEESSGPAGYEFAALPPLAVESDGHTSTNTEPEDVPPPPPPLPLLRRRKHQPTGRAHPRKEEVDDFPFVFECRLLPQSIQVQDHTIVVARVVRAITPQKDATTIDHRVQQDAQELCLTYADTRFWEMGREI
ncbi:hypothetical protein BO86DRAFT_374960 [Aspergillus japonicus CBS 114.51]|uniref:Flavin reductase like domain-containing protein n=1 Tax=Aspergillus japonicus CBS 114.51 TaxID=1448312 RepID=A0A8T8XFC8_ASPJA|nr:hypothetical protein BO86DRAFT_374960 [Aspergillus japonicus CBS 114.51]RAH87017.1 hypothetical protein BO86DRAFT_374960 [Aspergillus japonicus CBS 114.51]